MNANEFKSRTEKFLSVDEINHYETWYEPAYMAAQGIDKDDFCRMLRDPVTREFVCEVSCMVADRDQRKKDEAATRERLLEVKAYVEIERDRYRDALKLISTTCDRSGALDVVCAVA